MRDAAFLERLCVLLLDVVLNGAQIENEHVFHSCAPALFFV
ncbi:MAG: hypothetical protein QF395_08365 [Arenicellales bacterium]|nr:hypothetical protein [Arenicellales bacterium]